MGMHRSVRLALLIAAVPGLALAQPSATPEATPPPDSQAPQDLPPAPSETPPPPPNEPPGPPQANAPPPPAPQPAAAPAGRWVWTAQYGWLYLPYARQFVFVPGDPQVFPEQFVYYPVYGWRWVIAPWVYGYGPQPRWGVGGPRLFVWFAQPWFRVGGYWGWGGYRGWGPYRGWIGPRVWGPRGWARAPAYYRTGVGERHPARANGPRHGGEHERMRGEHRGHGR